MQYQVRQPYSIRPLATTHPSREGSWLPFPFLSKLSIKSAAGRPLLLLLCKIDQALTYTGSFLLTRISRMIKESGGFVLSTSASGWRDNMITGPTSLIIHDHGTTYIMVEPIFCSRSIRDPGALRVGTSSCLHDNRPRLRSHCHFREPSSSRLRRPNHGIASAASLCQHLRTATPPHPADDSIFFSLFISLKSIK